MNKKLLILLIAMLVLVSSVGYTEAIDFRVLTLDEATTLAMENNAELKTIDSKILLAERQYRSSVRESEDADTSGLTDSAYLEEGKTKELYPDQKLRELNDLKIDKANSEKDIQLDVEVTYAEIKDLEKELELSQSNLETFKLELKNKQNELELGLITASDLRDYELNVFSQELSITQVERSLEIKKMDLNHLMGLPLTTILALTEDVVVENIVLEYDIPTLVATVTETAEIVYDANNDLRLTKLEADVVRRYSRYEKPDSYDDLVDTIADKEKAILDAKYSVELQIYKDYNNLLNARDTVTINEFSLELSQMAYDIELVRNEIGLNTSLDVIKAYDDVMDKTNTLESSKMDFYKAYIEFENFLKFSPVIEVE